MFFGQRLLQPRTQGLQQGPSAHLHQMVVGVVLDDAGMPLCCEMWPGNTTDLNTLVPVVERVRKRFHVVQSCLVADRGMISAETLQVLEDPACTTPYILGARMRQMKETREQVLTRAGRYREVTPAGKSSTDPSPLKVKEVWVGEKRYIVCLNSKQAAKDAADREAILASLRDQLQKGPKALVGNKGYRKYLKIQRGDVLVGEKETGTAAWVLSKPASRTSFVHSKWAAAMVGVLVAIVVVPGMVAFGLISYANPGTLEPARFALGLVLVWINAAYYLTLTLMLGAFFNSRAGVIGIPLALAFGQQLIFGVLPFLAKILPWPIVAPVGNSTNTIFSAVVLGQQPASYLPLLVTLICIPLFLGLALWRFEREEL